MRRATLSVLPAKSAEMGKEKGEMPLPENESVAPDRVVRLDRERSPNEIREGAFLKGCVATVADGGW